MMIYENLTRYQSELEKITSSEQAGKKLVNLYNQLDLVDADREHFWVLGFNNKLRLRYIEEVAVGTGEKAVISTRQVFRTAVMKGVSTIIVAHNHPGGDLTPSPEDIKLTRLLIDGGKLLDLQVLDHIIVTAEGYYSLCENGDVFN